MPPLGLFVPSWLDIAGWGGVIFAAFALMGVGRLLSLGRASPESALVAGWGGAALLLTLWGAATPMTLRIPAIMLAIAGFAGMLAPGSRLSASHWRALGRIVTLALPLFVAMASARPSLPDTWLNLLPNAAYIYDHGFFPADARPDAHSFIAAAPYNMQLAAFMAGLVTPGFPPAAMIDFNLLFLLAAGLLLARLASGCDENLAPPWRFTALGLLLATLLNPGFDVRYQLSGYSETSVMVTVAFAGWFAARALDRIVVRRGATLDLWLMALTLAALVNIKQESISLVVGILVAAAVVALASREAARRSLLCVALAAVPALLLYLVWRWYVLSHFTLGELKPLPFEQWHVLELPLIVWNMLRAVFQHVLLFTVTTVVVGVALVRFWRHELDLSTRLAAMLAGIAVVYNAALLFAYVAHFEGEMGISAHSYYRYNTHLGLLLIASIVLLVRERDWRFSATWRRVIPAMLILIVLLDPFPFLRQLRFDLEIPNLRAWQSAHEAAARIVDDEHVVLILPSDNGTVLPTIEGVLRYTPPRRPDVTLVIEGTLPAGSVRTDFAHALEVCTTEGGGALLKRSPSGWDTEATWAYAPVPRGARWSQVLSPRALCVGR